MLIGDFSLAVANKYLDNFITTIDTESLIKSPTCLTAKFFFKHSNVFKIRISNHHWLKVNMAVSDCAPTHSLKLLSYPKWD